MVESSNTRTGVGLAPPPDFSGATDADLLEYMGLRQDDPELAKAAWAAFYERHVGYLYARCLKSYGDLANDIVQETFRRVFVSAHQFDRGRLEDSDDADASRRLTRSWLGQQGHWVATEFLADGTANPVADREAVEALPDLCRDSEGHPSFWSPRSLQIAREVADSLPPRERDILWATLHWWDWQNNKSHMPPEAVEKLARRWNTKPENIRKIRSRVIADIRARLQAAGCAEPAPR